MANINTASLQQYIIFVSFLNSCSLGISRNQQKGLQLRGGNIKLSLFEVIKMPDLITIHRRF